MLILKSIACPFGGDIYQVDVKGSFLHATLPNTENIWIKLTNIPSFLDSGKILRLIKSLCGLQQALRLWYQCFAGQICKF